MLEFLKIMLDGKKAEMDERGATAVEYGLLVAADRRRHRRRRLHPRPEDQGRVQRHRATDRHGGASPASIDDYVTAGRLGSRSLVISDRRASRGNQPWNDQLASGALGAGRDRRRVRPARRRSSPRHHRASSPTLGGDMRSSDRPVRHVHSASFGLRQRRSARATADPLQHRRVAAEPELRPRRRRRVASDRSASCPLHRTNATGSSVARSASTSARVSICRLIAFCTGAGQQRAQRDQRQHQRHRPRVGHPAHAGPPRSRRPTSSASRPTPTTAPARPAPSRRARRRAGRGRARGPPPTAPVLAAGRRRGCRRPPPGACRRSPRRRR